MKSIFFKAIATIVLLGVWGAIARAMNATQTLVMGRAAGDQFQNSDLSYIRYEMISQFINWPTAIGSTIVLAIVAAIWWGLGSKAVKAASATLGALLLVTILAPAPALAYYDKTDWTENFFILPSESAFYIPDVGANKDSQTKFGSLEYYEANKIASKRFNLPHTKLANSGSFSDFYVPAGRLIIVDRAPYGREWLGAADRGSTAKNQEFICQSKDGMNIHVGMAVNAKVTEENSAKFLYNFGVKPPVGDRTRPEVIFQSVYYGSSLAEAMDGTVRTQIGIFVCDDLSTHTLVEDNSKMQEIRKAIEVKAITYAASVGIDLGSVGWADTWGFDPEVQKALNDAFVAQTTGPYLETLKSLADIRVKEGLGDGLRNHGLPANLVTLPTDLVSGFTSMLGTKLTAPAALKQ